MSNNEGGLPNFLGDDFLYMTANLFLNEAGLAEAEEMERAKFVGKVMTDFVDKATAFIIESLQEEQLPAAIRIAESGMSYSEREIALAALIPDFTNKMGVLFDLFKQKIQLGIYS